MYRVKSFTKMNISDVEIEKPKYVWKPSIFYIYANCNFQNTLCNPNECKKVQKFQLVFEVAKKVGNKYHVCTSVKNDSFPQS